MIRDLDNFRPIIILIRKHVGEIERLGAVG